MDALKKEKNAATQRAAVANFGMMKSERAMELVLWMSVNSKAKKEAAAWLIEHGEHTKPFLSAASKKKTPEGKSAASLLAAL